MWKKFLLLIVFMIFASSLATFILMLNYTDPYKNIFFSLFAISFSFILLVSSFLTFPIYFIKKIHYRWETLFSHIIYSFRQAFFFSVFLVSLALFNYIWIPITIIWFLSASILIFLELFLQNIEEK